jgi:hypothetical protein
VRLKYFGIVGLSCHIDDTIWKIFADTSYSRDGVYQILDSKVPLLIQY